MADRLLRAQVSIPLDGALPEDSIVNTFYFDHDDGSPLTDEGHGQVIEDSLEAFYQAIDGVLFPVTVGPSATLKVYDMREAEPRVPIYVGGFTLTPTASEPMVNEVALCLSFKADISSGDVVARKRGRVYLGPIAQSAGARVADHIRPTSAVYSTVGPAAAALADGRLLVGSGTLRSHWAIYSKRADETGSTIDEAFSDVETGWIDNAFDTQRRRGAAATSRVTW